MVKTIKVLRSIGRRKKVWVAKPARKCVYCGKLFPLTNIRRKYCSPECNHRYNATKTYYRIRKNPKLLKKKYAKYLTWYYDPKNHTNHIETCKKYYKDHNVKLSKYSREYYHKHKHEPTFWHNRMREYKNTYHSDYRKRIKEKNK